MSRKTVIAEYQAKGFPLVARWRVRGGTIKPVYILDLGAGFVRDPDSCLMKQEAVGRYESFHLSEAEAVAHIVAQAEIGVTNAKRELKRAERYLAGIQKRSPAHR